VLTYLFAVFIAIGTSLKDQDGVVAVLAQSSGDCKACLATTNDDKVV
jgi:hypothetical protein